MVTKEAKKLQIKCKYKGGGSLVKHEPVFSNDGQTVFIAWRNLIVAYNTKTGKKTHELKGLVKEIVGFGSAMINGLEYVIAASKQGKVLIWKADSGLKLCKKKVPHHLLGFKVVNTPGNELYPQAVIVTEKNNRILFGFYDLNEEKVREIYSISKESDYFFDIGNNESLLGIASNRTVYAINLQSKTFTVAKKNMAKGRKFTAIALHKQQECLITGDDTGRIILWQNLFESPTQAVYHWHTLPVKTLFFSTSGSLFYSGGSENVLVKWSVEDPNQKKFLPRLPSAIEHISVSNNNSHIAVSTLDNGIQIIDSRFNLISTVQHLVLAQNFPCGLKYDVRTKSVVLNGFTGHVQFYSPNDMHLLYNLDITNQNKLTDERTKTMLNTEVVKLAISKSGHWLATVEERKDIDLKYEQRLKFWHFNLIKQTFELKTSVEYPHENPITDLQFQPSLNDKDLYCVTTGEDKKFKIWQSESTEKGLSWHCSGVGYYKNFIPKACSFSSDGSILAIAFNSALTLWIPDTLELKSALIPPLIDEELKQIAFGTGNDCHLICTISENHLTVWNLLTLCINWTVNIQCNLLVNDPFTNNFALFTKQQKLFIFTLASSSPVYESGHELLRSKGTALSAVFVPNVYSNDTTLDWHQRSRLYFIDSKHELYCIDKNGDLTEPDQLPQEDLLSSNDLNSNLFKSSLSRSRSSNVKKDVPYSHLYKKADKVLEEIVYGPNTTKLPVRMTCSSVLYSMIYQKNA